MTCDETGPAALMRRDDEFSCGNCEARKLGRPEAFCSRCNRMAPFERDHIDGRQVSNTTEIKCINCHRIRHSLSAR
jgi:hypothetical protein